MCAASTSPLMRAMRAAAYALVFGAALALSAAHAFAQDSVSIRGDVLDAATGEPVSGAEIRAVCAAAATGCVSASTISGADGTWHMRLPEGRVSLVVQHISFGDASVDVAAGDVSSVVVRLTPRPVSLTELVVTASRRQQQLKDAAVATEVVRRDELERSGAADLSAVLVERTGVALEGGHPIGAGVMLQGLGSERVLVLVDGQPFIGRISGGLDLSRIPTAMIERVEVVKGPQSTLYGSEAMGGVVNVITRSPRHDVWEGSAQVTGGSHDRLDASASLVGGAGSTAWSVDGGRRTIELVPGHAGEAGTFATRIDTNARVQWRASSSLLLHAGALLLDESQRWRTGVLYNFTDNTQWGGRAGATYTRGAHRLSPTLYVTEFRHLARRSTLPRPVANPDDEAEVQQLAEAELLYGIATKHVAVDAGVEARREYIRSDRVAGGDRTLHTVEPFAQATWSRHGWTLVPGMRLTWSEQWGVHATPRIAAMYRPVDRLAIRASVGQGFRAPSFKELYMDFLNTGAGAGYRVQGNASLRPESSRNVTGSAEWTGDRFYSRVQLFYNRFDDFIEARETAAPGGDLTLFVYGNVDDGETYGTEFEVGATWGGLRAEAGYGWLESRDRTSGEPLPGRPTHTARTSVSYTLPFGLDAGASATFTGATRTAITDAGAPVTRAAFARVDARISQSLPGGFHVNAGVDNIMDTRPAHHPGFLGRELYVGLGWKGSRTHEPVN